MQNHSQELYLKHKEDIIHWYPNVFIIHIVFLYFSFQNDVYVLCLATCEPSHHNFFLCTLKEKRVNINSLNNVKLIRMYNWGNSEPLSKE